MHKQRKMLGPWIGTQAELCFWFISSLSIQPISVCLLQLACCSAPRHNFDDTGGDWDLFSLSCPVEVHEVLCSVQCIRRCGKWDFEPPRQRKTYNLILLVCLLNCYRGDQHLLLDHVFYKTSHASNITCVCLGFFFCC